MTDEVRTGQDAIVQPTVHQTARAVAAAVCTHELPYHYPNFDSGCAAIVQHMETVAWKLVGLVQPASYLSNPDSSFTPTARRSEA